MVEVRDPAPWSPSTTDARYLETLVEVGLLPKITDERRPEWIAPPPSHREPNPPANYVVSFARLHERGFGIPVGRFIRDLCDHYKVELHNFALNAISQAATFVGVCEGFLGIPVHWDLWVHLFRGELNTNHEAKGVRRAVRVDALTLSVRNSRKEQYILSLISLASVSFSRSSSRSVPALAPTVGTS
ncbi:unnamed protein product [Urochloa humidicola]